MNYLSGSVSTTCACVCVYFAHVLFVCCLSICLCDVLCSWCVLSVLTLSQRCSNCARRAVELAFLARAVIGDSRQEERFLGEIDKAFKEIDVVLVVLGVEGDLGVLGQETDRYIEESD